MPPCRQLAQPVQPIVFLPHNISTAKMDQLQQQGAQTVQHGTDCVEAELQAKAWAHQTGAVYISPYNDLQVGGWEPCTNAICTLTLWVCPGLCQSTVLPHIC